MWGKSNRSASNKEFVTVVTDTILFSCKNSITIKVFIQHISLTKTLQIPAIPSGMVAARKRFNYIQSRNLNLVLFTKKKKTCNTNSLSTTSNQEINHFTIPISKVKLTQCPSSEQHIFPLLQEADNDSPTYQNRKLRRKL